MGDEPLNDEQLQRVRRLATRLEPQEIANELGLPRNQIERELTRLEEALPAWDPARSRVILAIGLCLLFVLGAAVWSSNLNSGYHFDDTHTALDQVRIPTLRRYMRDAVREDDSPMRKLRELRKGSMRAAEEIFRWNPFRVVTYMTFAYQDWWLNGLADKPPPSDPWLSRAKTGVHVFNDAVHLLNGLLAALLAYLTFTAPAFRRSLSANRYPAIAALMVGVVFTLHPMQSQAVTYVSQRAESMAATCYLTALILFALSRRRLKHDDAGSAPWLTPLLWSAAGGLLGGLVILARLEALGFSLCVKLGLGVIVAAIVGTVVLVKRGMDERWHAAAVSGTFVAFGVGLEVKEIVATLPVAIVAWELLFAREPAPKSGAEPGAPWLLRGLKGLLGDAGRTRTLAPWLVLILLAGVGVLAVGGQKVTDQLTGKYVLLGGRERVPLGPAQYLPTEANVAHTYVRLAVLPYGLNLDHDYPLAVAPEVEEGYAKPLTTHPLVTLLSIASLLGAAALALLYGGRARIPAFALVLGGVVLAPSSSLIVLADVIYEHRFYLPMFGVGLVAAAVVERALRLWAPEHLRSQLYLGVVLLLALGGSYLTWQRNKVWRSSLALWHDIVLKSPQKPRSWINLGLEYQNRETHLLRYPDGQIEWCHLRGLVSPADDPRLLVLNVSKLTPQPRLLRAKEVAGFEPSRWSLVGKEFVGTQNKARELYGKVTAMEPHRKALNNLALIATYQRHNHLAEIDTLIRLRKQYEELGSAELLEAVDQRIELLNRDAEALAREALDCFVKQRQVSFHRANNLGNLYHSAFGDYPQANLYLERAILYPEAPPETWAILGDVRKIWGELLYLAPRRPNSPLAAQREAYEQAARKRWEQARESYREFLRRKRNRRYEDRVRAQLKEVDGYLAGKAPAPRTWPEGVLIGDPSATP